MVFFSEDIDNLGLSAEESFRTLVTAYQYLISKTEIRRVLLIIDADDVSFRDFKKFGPYSGLKIPALFNVPRRLYFNLIYTLIIFFFILIKNAFPIRFYGIHILNEHFFTKLVAKTMWPFLSSKIRKRVITACS